MTVANPLNKRLPKIWVPKALPPICGITIGKRSHQLSILPRNSTLRLCRDFNDINRLKEILKPIMVERLVDTPRHRNVGDYLQSTMDNLGWHTEWDEFQDKTPYGVKNFRSLIATYDPQAPRRLVLACHYDSMIMPGDVFIGATDSAVPCSIMIDIAKTLTPYMYKRAASSIGLQLLFLDGEEAFVKWSERDSTYGSRHLAAKWEKKWYPTSSTASQFELSRELDRIDVFMLLDLLGAQNPRINNVLGHGANSLFEELPKIEAELKQMGCISSNIPDVFNGRAGFMAVEDDHIPFMKRGVPILHMIATPFPRVWHTKYDNEKALHYPTIAYLTSIFRVFVAKYLGIAPL